MSTVHVQYMYSVQCMRRSCIVTWEVQMCAQWDRWIVPSLERIQHTGRISGESQNFEEEW